MEALLLPCANTIPPKSPTAGDVKVPSLFVSPGLPALSSLTDVITILLSIVPLANNEPSTNILKLL